MATILIAEDDELQAELVGRYLRREGHRTTIVGDGQDALAAVTTLRPDLVVLDIMLPRMDGFTVCRALRAQGHDMPIVMLTARDTEDDLLTGLELGADDYVAKPYSPRELVARAAVLLRRLRPDGAEVMRVGPLEIDPARHRVALRGQQVVLTRAEFQLIAALAENAGLVLSRSRLLQYIHGSDSFLTARTIDTHVKNLRLKLEADPPRPELIRTVYGIGYTLDAGTDA